jgi:hypothetical protein
VWIEAVCRMVTEFWFFWLFLQGIHCNFSDMLGPLSSFTFLIDQFCG